LNICKNLCNIQLLKHKTIKLSIITNIYCIAINVNHINEIRYDNYYKNLEWVSIAKNNQHSKNISINMLDNHKNIIKTFESYTSAYNYLNKKNTGCIPKQIKRNETAYGYYW
jgi:hypothetical protein